MVHGYSPSWGCLLWGARGYQLITLSCSPLPSAVSGVRLVQGFYFNLQLMGGDSHTELSSEPSRPAVAFLNLSGGFQTRDNPVSEDVPSAKGLRQHLLCRGKMQLKHLRRLLKPWKLNQTTWETGGSCLSDKTWFSLTANTAKPKQKDTKKSYPSAQLPSAKPSPRMFFCCTNPRVSSIHSLFLTLRCYLKTALTSAQPGLPPSIQTGKAWTSNVFQSLEIRMFWFVIKYKTCASDQRHPAWVFQEISDSRHFTITARVYCQ